MILLKIKHLSKTYSKKNLFSRSRKAEKKVVRSVSLDVLQGEILALVGESGSGKTTLARAVLRLVEPSSGEIIYRGKDLLRLNRKQFRPYRRHFQMIFQHPDRAFDPRQTVAAVLSEAIKMNRNLGKEDRTVRTREMLELVHLHENYLTRYPHELSGGEQQRLLVARALAVTPEFLIADEPTSSLDAVVKQDILNLLINLKEKLGLTLLFISHDLGAVHRVADRIAVMYKGRIIELGSRSDIYGEARHPYTKMLLHSIHFRKNKTSAVTEEHLSFPETDSSCDFAPRCQEATEYCRHKIPLFKQMSPGHRAACHFFQQETAEQPAAVAAGM